MNVSLFVKKRWIGACMISQAPKWLYHKAIRWTILRFLSPPFLHLILIRLWSPPKNKVCQLKILVSQKSQWRLSQALHYCPILSSRGQKKNEEDKRLIWWIMTFVTCPLWRIIVGLINFILWYFVVNLFSPIIFTGRSTFN